MSPTKSTLVRDGLQKRVHQQHVDHRGFINHEEIAVERTFLVLAEPSRLGIDLEEPMDRFGWTYLYRAVDSQVKRLISCSALDETPPLLAASFGKH
jgi:hypothetical protein